MSAYSNGAAKFHIEAKRRVMQRFSRLSFLPSFAEGHGCKRVDECEVGTLRSLGEGGYASEGSARRSVWRGATTVRPWGSTRGGFTAETKEQYTEHWGREGFYGDGVNVILPHHMP